MPQVSQGNTWSQNSETVSCLTKSRIANVHSMVFSNTINTRLCPEVTAAIEQAMDKQKETDQPEERKDLAWNEFNKL